MKKHVMALAAVLATCPLLAGCGNIPSDGGTTASAQTSPTADARRYLDVYGFYPSQTLAEYLASADTVIQGTVLDVKTVKFVDEHVPDSLKGGASQHITVRVDQRISGDPPNVITLRRLASTEELEFNSDAYQGTFDVGAPYLMVLFEGSGMWAGSYLLQGSQAVSPITGGLAHFPSGVVDIPGENDTISLRKIEEIVSSD